MKRIVAVIGAGELGTHAVLAREALKKAAQSQGDAIAVELRTLDGVQDPLEAQALAGSDRLLLVGEVADAPGFAGLATIRATIAEVLDGAASVLNRAPGGIAAGASPLGAAAASGALKIVAITSCPTGIAHTFMAAEGLQEGAKALGHAIRVETQGSVGSQDALTPEEIAAADLIIIAADRQVEMGRFAGKKVYSGPTKPAINNGAALIQKAMAEALVQGGTAATPGQAAGPANKAGVYKHLMTGVSFMLPFVVAGGLLIAIAFALGGIYVYEDQFAGTLGHTLFQIGAKGAFTLMVPALAGYIAYSVADRPGIAPGMTGGVIAGSIGAGFLGGILAGFIAGYAVLMLTRAIKLPRTLQGLMPVLILPLLATAITGLLMYYVVGAPTARVLAALTAWLQGMQGSSAAILGLILGGMMAVDMGGPINKAAYVFGTTLIASNVTEPMAAVMCGGMTPPLALAIASRLFASRFTPEEREAGNAAFVLGLAFVTEGAIPFAARDPLRVIPSLVAGSAVAGAICMVMGVQLKVPHGGIFVLPIPNAVVNLPGFIIAMLVGTAVSVVALGMFKRRISAPAAVAQPA